VFITFERQTVLTTGKRGTWYPVIVDGKRTAKLVCPGCGIIANIDDHDIDHDGNVTPSILCDCGYHENVILAGWL
jgi:hypothetical protein